MVKQHDDILNDAGYLFQKMLYSHNTVMEQSMTPSQLLQTVKAIDQSNSAATSRGFT